MEITTEFISEKFKEFNAEYFEGKLNTPRFEVMHTKSLLGELHFDSFWSVYRHKWVIYGYAIRISDYYNRPQHYVEETILHEMIHLYIAQFKLKDTRTHGKIFYSIADRINKQGGWNIARVHKGEVLVPRETKNDGYWVGCYRSVDMKKYVSFVMSKSKIEYFKKQLSSCPNLCADWFIFHSYDNAAFGHYPKCRRRIRGWFISEEEFNKYKKVV